MNNLKYALRQLLKYPGFTAIAVLTLALGIGANTAIFSVINGVLLRPLPYPQPGQLVKIRKEAPPGDVPVLGGGSLIGGHEFSAWREQSKSLAQIAAYGSGDCSLTGRGTAERVRRGDVTASLFPMLGVSPRLGRLFLPEEEVPNGPRVALLSYGLWQRRFGGDPGILNQSIRLDGESHTIIGVLPASFQFTDPNDVWVPMQMQRGPEVAGGAVAISLLQAMARLRPGVSIAEAEAELQLIAGRVNLSAFQPVSGLNSGGPEVPLRPPEDLKSSQPGEGPVTLPFPGPGKMMVSRPPAAGPSPGPGDQVLDITQPAHAGQENVFDATAAPAIDGASAPMLFGGGGKVQLMGLHEYLVANVRRSVLVMMCTVGVVLLIACANVANLLLARAVSRRREIAVRLALGAQRARIVRQFLTESLLLALSGGALGLLFAWWGVRVLGVLTPQGTAHLQPVGLDLTVLVFTLMVAVTTGLIFGLAPAFQSAGIPVSDALKEAGHTAGESLGRQRLRGALVIAETALALVLLVGAGLLANSFVRLRSVNPGFNPDGLLTFQLNLQSGTHDGATARAVFIRRLREELSSLPGVRSVAMTDHLPLTTYSIMTSVSVAGEPREKFRGKPAVSVAAITENYFDTLGIAVKRGRGLTVADQAPRNIVVNERFAREYFPGESAVGKRLNDFEEHLHGPGVLTIVGVVADTRQDGFDGGVTPEIYVLSMERAPDFFSTAIQFAGDPATLSRAVRDRIQVLDPDLVAYDLMTLRERLSATVASRRAILTLLGAFAGLAMVLAAVGIYGVMSFTVSQRTREIGVRMSLGAQAWDVTRVVLREGMSLVVVGLIIGLVIAVLAARSLASLLFEIGTADPSTLVVVSLLVAAVGGLACWLPARRAARVDPMRALRDE